MSCPSATQSIYHGASKAELICHSRPGLYIEIAAFRGQYHRGGRLTMCLQASIMAPGFAAAGNAASSPERAISVTINCGGLQFRNRRIHRIWPIDRRLTGCEGNSTYRKVCGPERCRHLRAGWVCESRAFTGQVQSTVDDFPFKTTADLCTAATEETMSLVPRDT